MSNFSVPYNFDESLIDIYGMFGVNDMYFPIHPSYTASARGGKFPDVEEYDKNLQKVCGKLRALNIKPMMLLNGNIDPVTELKSRNKIFDCISKLDLYGVTVSNIFLIPLLKKVFPDLKVRTSVLMGTGNAQQVKQLVDLGADEICLRTELVREYQKLKSIREAFPTTTLSIIVNSACEYYCAYYNNHHQVACSSSVGELNDESKDLVEDIVNNPCRETNFLKAPFVRPEDLHNYQFIDLFKLVDRNFKSPQLVDVLQSYVDGKVTTPCINFILGIYCNRQREHIANFPKDFFEVTAFCGHHCETCDYCDKLYVSQCPTCASPKEEFNFQLNDIGGDIISKTRGWIHGQKPTWVEGATNGKS